MGIGKEVTVEPQKRNAGAIAGGVALIAFGLLVLLGQIFARTDFWKNMWPIFPIALGVIFYVVMFAGGKGAAGFAIPATIITMIGLILLFQNLTGQWETWSYAWALVFPTSIGLGLLIKGLWEEREPDVRQGRQMVLVGLIIFVAAAVFFAVIIGIGAGGLYQTERQIRLGAGESVQIGDFEMVFNSVTRFAGADDLLITEADVDLYKNGEFLRTLNPQIEFYQRSGQPMTIPSARSTITEDFYVILVNWEPTTADSATFRIFLNPLINWIWTGGLVFLMGTLIAAWPEREKVPVRARKPAVAAASGD